MKELGKVGFIGRFKPLHNGGAMVLEEICKNANHVLIGIGSSNKYNLRNPFTAKESKEMIDAFLSKKYSNYSFVFIPDYAQIPLYKNGERWKQEIIKNFGKLDYFVTGNPYVKNLLCDTYKIIHSAKLIPLEKQIRLRATMVRYEIAINGNWEKYVPKEVADYLKPDLINRFKREFGLATIANLYNIQCNTFEDSMQEKNHAAEA